MFISIESVDGAGKTTQVKILVEKLRDRGYEVVLTREPGGTPGADQIRSMILGGDTDRWSPMTEVLLFTAARRDHVEKVIRPALQSGKIVISDRYVDSTRAYQSVRGDDLRKTIDLLHNETIGLDPDLTLLMDIDPVKAWERANQRNDAAVLDEGRFEKLGHSFQEKVRSAFLELAAAHDDRFALIDASGSIEEIAAQIEQAVMTRLDHIHTPGIA